MAWQFIFPAKQTDERDGLNSTASLVICDIPDEYKALAEAERMVGTTSADYATLSRELPVTFSEAAGVKGECRLFVTTIAALIMFLASFGLPSDAAWAGAATKASILAAAKAAVTDNFRDPDGAEYRNVRVYNVGRLGVSYLVCGEVNGRNAYGAFVGYNRFSVQLSGHGAAVKPIITYVAGPDGLHDQAVSGTCDNASLRQTWLM